MRNLAPALLAVVLLAACSAEGETTTEAPADTSRPVETAASEPPVEEPPTVSSASPTDADGLRVAVTAYSDAFLDGQPVEAYDTSRRGR